MRLSVPGKTFIAGEYLILQEGKALIAATSPRFEMEAHPGQSGIEGFHPESPAALLLARYPEKKQSWKFIFKDPYKMGGFGASTAQFLAVASVVGAPLAKTAEFLKIYRECAWNGEGLPPSGADLLGQWQGALSFFDAKTNGLSKAKWPFADLQWTLISTGQKMATHTHLRSLKNLNVAGMRSAFAMIESALTEKDQAPERKENFLQGIRDYARALHTENLTAERSAEILSALAAVPGVRAAKACGAMGADVIVTFHDANSELDSFLVRHGLQKIATDADLSEGLRMETEK